MQKTSEGMEINEIEYQDESITIAFFGFFGLSGFCDIDKKIQFQMISSACVKFSNETCMEEAKHVVTVKNGCKYRNQSTLLAHFDFFGLSRF